MLLLAACGGGSSSSQNNGGAGNGGGGGTGPVQHVATPVTTYHNDNSRTGANVTETHLTHANVNVVSFGKLASVAVEGDIYAQPLYVPNVVMADGSKRNLVFVVTEHDQAYAVDAKTYEIVWHTDFLSADGSVLPPSSQDVNCADLAPEIGITGTPVIDTTRGAIYFVVRTKETSNGEVQFFQRLHALSLTTGQEVIAPTVITTPPGQWGLAVFDPLLNNQRSALSLVNGQVFVAWASLCDYGNYQGWVMSFDDATLQPTGAWTPTPGGDKGGIWMAGGGPASDQSGDLYLVVGNGATDVMTGGANYGDSVVRLNTTTTAFSVTDYFTPFDYQNLYDEDLDLGSGAAVVLPDQAGEHEHLLLMASKAAVIYLIDRDDAGRWHDGDNRQIVQSFRGNSSRSFCTPAFWGNLAYFSFRHAPLEAYAFNPGTEQLRTTPSTQSGFEVSGGTPSVSSNGVTDGIVWFLDFHQSEAIILRAFSATDLSTELYDSELSPDRDHGGGAVSHTVPTVADGLVFVGASHELDIYGLLGN